MAKKNNGKRSKDIGSLGKHLIIELKECNSKKLMVAKMVKKLMLKAARVSGVTIIESRFHNFSPFGVSGIITFAKSYLSIHTWPEHRYAAVDIFFTNGDIINPRLAADYLAKSLGAKMEIKELDRGIFPVAKGKILPHKIGAE